jgi:uncharacterized membrane protein (DUF106 family)
MSILDNLFGGTANDIINGISNILGKFIPDATLKQKAQEEIQNAIQNTIQQELQNAKESITTEEQGNWLQRSWRPLVMLSFTFILLYQYFISQIFKIPTIQLPDDFFILLKIGLGGYIGLRSVEKIVTTLKS